MKRKYVSFGEIEYFIIIYMVVTFTIWLIISRVFWDVLFISILAPCVIFLIFYSYYYFYSKKHLPAKCIFNPFGYIEFHIGNKNKNDKFKSYRLCAEAVLKAKDMNNDVLCDTWIISPNKMYEIFGDAFKIEKSSIFQKFANFDNMLKFNRKKLFTAKCYRYIIYTNKLTEEHVKLLKRMARK